MAEIIIDGVSYEAEEGISLLEAIESLGLDLPYFCWHPALGAVGSCRQCAVISFKDENDEKGKLIMACMEPVKDKMRISITADRAVKFRAAVIEWLMTNHPHDCPVCDEGGECHLQDMTVMTGHNYRRYRFKKRTFRNQDLGPFIYHEMNRCITCYRCVRFYNDYAGGNDLAAIGAHNHVYFGRLKDGTLESEFSGNLVEVCPTGVFTDKTLRKHYSRKWDLQSSPSVCHHCGLGCNIFVGTRYDKPVRILNRYNPHVNNYFICDRGRFGYDFMNSEDRLISIESSSQNGQITSEEDAIKYLSPVIKESGTVIGIGSPRATLEANYALKKLVGARNFSNGISSVEHSLLSKIFSILTDGPVPSASLQDVAAADAVFILGEDITQTAPIMALQVRQAVRNKPMTIADRLHIPRWNDFVVRELVQDEKGPLYIASVSATRLDDIARDTYRAAPDDIARLGFAVAAEISSKAPAVAGISDETRSLAKKIASDLMNAENPLIISGTGALSRPIIEAASNISLALQQSSKKTKIAFAVPECNTMGAYLLDGMNINDALLRIKNEKVKTVIMLENDLHRRASRHIIDESLKSVGNLIVIDSIKHQTSENATLKLPSAPYDENSGTLINNEGRVQRFVRAIPAQKQVLESWRWLNAIMQMSIGGFEGWNNLDELSREAFDAIEVLKRNYQDIWSPGHLIEGNRIARASHRYSGRTAMRANINVSEPKPPEDKDSPFSFTMEGYQGGPPKAINPFYWAPGWNSVQSLNEYRDGINKNLPGGDTGIRVILPGGDSKFDYFKTIPQAAAEKSGHLLIAPLYHIFGSEQLSSKSPPISELIPGAYIALNKSEAKKQSLNKGDTLKITKDNFAIQLPLKIIDSLPDGVAGLPVGLDDSTAFVSPGYYELSKEGKPDA